MRYCSNALEINNTKGDMTKQNAIAESETNWVLQTHGNRYHELKHVEMQKTELELNAIKSHTKQKHTPLGIAAGPSNAKGEPRQVNKMRK